MQIPSHRSSRLPALVGTAMLAAAVAGCASPERDRSIEARAAQIVRSMTLEQKVGQMTQAEIRYITPEQVRRHYIGSVLNGGGSWPHGKKDASASDWLALARQFHDASMATDMAIKVPVIWGTDAVHGHNNAFGATVFPHNIGLGAAHDPALVRRIGAATGRAVRATGIQWVFAPTLAVAQDARWGRTYESFSDDPGLVGAYAGAYVQGLQGRFDDDANVVATAKHFIGDGGTAQGRDQGVTEATPATLLDVHGRGHVAALGAGVQTVMASFSSWNDVAAGVDHGKVHGSRLLLTDLLKTRLGFDGFVVSDWNGIGQVPGCSNASCPQAINAGIDMVMVPEDWEAFIANTVAQVRRGEIPMARIDDAVTRIVRVKLRAGLFAKGPQDNVHAGDAAALRSRALAREAVRKSLVLLKNDGDVLPLQRGKRVLVVGKSARSLANQTGGWTLTWQGTSNRNADFPNGDTLLAGIEEAAGAGQVSFSQDAKGLDAAKFDVVIAVIGETPFAEGNGDIPPSGTLRHSSRYPEDLAVLDAVSGRGTPVVTVLVASRPLYVNDLLNRSDAFVAAWLPGTEGKGVADVLFRRADGGIDHDFVGRLPFPWPGSPCPIPQDARSARPAPLFARGAGLGHADHARLGRISVSDASGGCAAQSEMPIFKQSARAPYGLLVAAAGDGWNETELDDEPSSVIERPATHPDIRVETSEINTQHDARLVTWSGSARLLARSAQPAALNVYPDAALQFDVVVVRRPQAPVTLQMACGRDCAGAVDLTDVLSKLPTGTRRVVKVPLACFAQDGADLSRIDVPFSVSTTGAFSAAFADIRVVAAAARDADALACRDVRRAVH
ncbi:MAG TPA: glycoside hydrolase family 3 N-terminal domain-containing protein [Albitalea sp.]|nr:glycoside hydrolase family 3 N-terminal domain-containing protein [Albitalea sp.]